MIVATKVRAGMMILYNGDLCRVVKKNHVTPGKGKAHISGTLRVLKTGVQIPFRWNSDEKIERALLEEHVMEYLYNDGQIYHLMNVENYEQIEMDQELFGEAINYILPNTKVSITFHEGKPVGIELPQLVDLKVTDAEPSIKRQTATTSYKRATLETGLTVMVPPFVEAGETIRINTETGEYQERVSK